MSAQRTSTILMIRPVAFRMNEQTTSNNYYQKVLKGINKEEIADKAREEFDRFVDTLASQGIQVLIVEDDPNTDTPDAVFPNNWVSFHADGRIGMYPMFAPNRRQERREDIFARLQNECGMQVEEIVDFTEFEEHEKYLEGTGSMVLDRESRIAYASLSERTDPRALELWCEEMSFRPVAFTSYQTVGEERKPIYHTNVMMAIGKDIAIICAECIDDEVERTMVLDSLTSSGKEIIEITEDQVRRFAGNMLEVVNEEGIPYMVMSDSAFESLNPSQVERIERHNRLLHSSLDIIEACGGGSARCMMAEVFLPKI